MLSDWDIFTTYGARKSRRSEMLFIIDDNLRGYVIEGNKRQCGRGGSILN
jgi:hypothetical protein